MQRIVELVLALMTEKGYDYEKVVSNKTSRFRLVWNDKENSGE